MIILKNITHKMRMRRQYSSSMCFSQGLANL